MLGTRVGSFFNKSWVVHDSLIRSDFTTSPSFLLEGLLGLGPP